VQTFSYEAPPLRRLRSPRSPFCLGFGLLPGSSSQAAGATAAAVVWFLVLSFFKGLLDRAFKAGKSNQLPAPHDGSKALCVGKTDCLGDVGRYFL